MLKIEVGQYVKTPRFLKVKICEIFEEVETAELYGYTEPTFYWDSDWIIIGKSIGNNLMKFCAVKR